VTTFEFSSMRIFVSGISVMQGGRVRAAATKLLSDAVHSALRTDLEPAIRAPKAHQRQLPTITLTWHGAHRI
jgi:hypothetical protein